MALNSNCLFNILLPPKLATPIMLKCVLLLNAGGSIAMHCNAKCNSVQRNAIQCNVMQCNSMQCHAMPCNALEQPLFCQILCHCRLFNLKLMQCRGVNCNAVHCRRVNWGGVIYCTLAGSTTEAIRYNEGHLIEGSVLLHFTSHWKHSIERQCILHYFGPFLILLPKVLIIYQTPCCANCYVSPISGSGKHNENTMSLQYLARENTMKIQTTEIVLWANKYTLSIELYNTEFHAPYFAHDSAMTFW